MAANNETKTPENAPLEPSLAELKDMLVDIQVKVTGIQHENLITCVEQAGNHTLCSAYQCMPDMSAHFYWNMSDSRME